MPGGSSNGGRGANRNNGKKTESKQILELRSACPDHKKGDFDQLVKQLKGDEAKIQQKIQEWWEDPHQPQEEKWEDVNKKPSTKPKHGSGGGGGKPRAAGDGRGGGGGGGGRSAINGEGRGRAGRGRGGRGGRGDRKFREGPPKQIQNKDGSQEPEAQRDDTNKKDVADQQGNQQRVGVPKPVTSAPAPKGAWGRALGGGSAAPAPTAPTTLEKPAIQPHQQTQQPSVSAAPQQPSKKDTLAPLMENLEVSVLSKSDPTPAGVVRDAEIKPAPRPLPVSGNVWATKGSAHLIQAEKPKAPAPAPPVAVASVPVEKTSEAHCPIEEEHEDPVSSSLEDPMDSTLETGLPPAVANSVGGWGTSEPGVTASEPKPALEMTPPPEGVVTTSLSSSMAPAAQPVSSAPVVDEPAPLPSKPRTASASSKPPRPAPANVLNMGHWETGDTDDSQNLDFGFGSFGTENEGAMDGQVSAPSEGTSASNKSSTPPITGAAAAAASAVSPARPPPGLSIGGMPPMPANAVLVHELETSLESTALNAPKPDQPAPQEKPMTNPLPPQPASQVPNVPTGAVPVLPGGQNYNQYGMTGMYGYNAPGSGFVGVHAPAGPFLAGVGVIPQQQPPKVGATSPQPDATSVLPHAGGLYHHVSAPSSGNAPDTVNGSSDISATNAAPAAPGMPPGMPGMPPFNPALYYGQQPFHLGQHQGGMGYNYGYGQFGGVQGGFGYQQVMGQSGGYGAPHYADDGQHQPGLPHQGHQANTHAHHAGGSGGYQKNNGGGYRGRNNHAHQNNNHYQNQYNPQQHGGYAGQPYGMGHYNDHFNQRGGYAMGDMYGMQQQQQQQQPGIHAAGSVGAAGFQDDSDHHNKGRRGGNNRNNNSNSTALNQFQGGPHGQLSGGGQQPFGLQGHTNESAQTATGAGWSNNNHQAGGWSGATSSWQQGN